MKSIILFVIISISFLFGMMSHKNQYFPAPQLHEVKEYFFPNPIIDSFPPKAFIDKFISIYKHGTPVYSNRAYYDTVGDPSLDGLFILQIPRHASTPIGIKVLRKVKIYRLLTSSNDSTIFSDWLSTDIKVGVRGWSSTHTTVVSKVFLPGIYFLQPGGPVASSPILIECVNNKSNLPITVLNSKGKGFERKRY